jgi:hypothetical protein
MKKCNKKNVLSRVFFLMVVLTVSAGVFAASIRENFVPGVTRVVTDGADQYYFTLPTPLSNGIWEVVFDLSWTKEGTANANEFIALSDNGTYGSYRVGVMFSGEQTFAYYPGKINFPGGQKSTLNNIHHFKIIVNMNDQKASIYYTLNGGSEVAIIENVAFTYTSFPYFLVGSNSQKVGTLTTVENIVFTQLPTTDNNIANEDLLRVYCTQSNITVKGTLEGDMVQVYGVDGRMMLQKTIWNENVNVNLEKGIYLVKVVDCTGNQVKIISKIILE